MPSLLRRTMDIQSIKEAIEELENSSTTLKNVTDLAALYTVRNNLFEGLQSTQEPSSPLPCYNSYITAKREYQLDENTEGSVIKSMKNLCQDIDSFFDRLYSNTDMAKERRCISELVDSLHLKFHM